MTARARLVLDTNVLLDWLVFEDPAVARLGRAIEEGTVLCLATAEMLEELRRVLAYPQFAARVGDSHAILRRWQRHAVAWTEGLSPARLRCTDPDDQKFLDLAFAAQAHWLLSKDRAVLRLAGRAARLGLRIATPARWNPPDEGGSAPAGSAHRRQCSPLPSG
ncbi:putative toxin-antitoxin system toxin component, PIN family [Caldimonas aquatica]|uniref:Toxin-antitoxin system toxin component, PIN family n=1 Tax=Caldimonas aquatica TaxID=376175 RepID=A0ABY6MRN1_9BURK|nr:putative toxin-antitoxin system toxin component, PIN family [Schlegelella aquatica]UZD54671.1 putative toxin-antitoxin system toxin component, PIN family [Schlegelella aquatica]